MPGEKENFYYNFRKSTFSLSSADIFSTIHLPTSNSTLRLKQFLYGKLIVDFHIINSDAGLELFAK